MSGLDNPIEQLSPLKRAVLALERMQAKLDQYERPSKQVEDPSVTYHSHLALKEQDVMDRLNGFISDHEQLSPLKRAVLALERLQERLMQFEKANTPATHREERTAELFTAARETQPLPLRAQASQERLALSFAQQRLWFLEQLNPEQALYNEHCALRIQGPLNLHAMEQALGAILQRHEILRTSFPAQDGVAVQYVHSWQPLRLVPVDLCGFAASERMLQARKLAEEEVKRPFALAHGPLLRFKLYQVAENEALFLIVIHHLIADGWSMGIFFRELSALYAASCRGAASPLKALTLQYADYAIWQHQWLQGDTLNAKLAYWEGLLAGAPQALELPTNHPRPALQAYGGAHLSFTLPGTLVDALQTLSQQAGVTLYTVLLAAFQVLLWCYTGQDDFLVGTPVINRKQAELEDLIGFFVNTLVLRANPTGNPTFLAFIERVSKQVLDAYVQQDVPFDRLLAALMPQRDLSRSPLFQVIFSMHQASWAKADLAELTVSPAFLENGRSRVDLTFEIVEGRGQIEGLVEYSTDLFDEASIDRFLKHWFTILERAAEAPQQHLSELAALPQTERERVLVTWNATVCEREVIAIHQGFERVARHRSESVAAVFEDIHVTYQELHRRSHLLAASLLQQGVVPETLVGICVERSLDMLIAVLGVLKAGGAYVPLDPAYPYARLKFLLEDTKLSLLLTQKHLVGRLPASGVQILCLDTDWKSILAASSEISSLPQIDPHHLAYIIYTSGSTGVPKGVMVEHRGLNNLVQAQIQLFSVDFSSHVLQFASFGFDAWVSEVFTALLAGATLYLGTKEELLPGPALLRTLQHQAITCVTLPPTALAALPAADLPQMRTLVSAGEACTAELVALWSIGRCFVNAYGPTEATVCATAMQCFSDLSRPPIGRPIENVQVYLLCAVLQPVPVGVPGELYIGGAGLARGYLSRPDVTAAAFIPHPFSEVQGARLYRTGDVARYRADGTLEFLGRVDHQVKVRGFRIELGEIEAVLALHPAIRETVVVVREDTLSDKRIVAYMVIKENVTLSTSEAYAFLKERLPDHLIPATFVQLAAMPLNPHGKIDRQALPDPEAVRPVLETEYVTPRTRIERIIAEIWQDLLQIEEVGLDDNFFELGGHSLIISQLHARLCEVLQVNITVVDLFEYPTIKALTEFLHLSEDPPEVQVSDRKDDLPHPTKSGEPALSSSDIAIIGMAGRFPGARDIDEFWRNLQAGKESVSFFTQEELRAAGVDPALFSHECYVPAGALLEDVEYFDAAFFGYIPREAEIMDPQQRIFLECAWQALEDAGYNPEIYEGRIAVFGGATSSTYLTSNLLNNATLAGVVDQYQIMLGNSTDFLTSRVSYKFNLRGLAVTILTACSTSLVALHMACESLRAGTSDMALAGGVSIRFPQKAGYLYQKGGIMSPDGHCRAFAAEAQGIVGGEGVGIVVVKRLADALADGDTIRAVIRGSAVNNDGDQKVGYTAPGVQGQAAVITQALAMSSVEPQTVRYIEAHGTGTPLGDPIEVAALQQVYGPHLSVGQCALGSVKSNIGHLDAAAGVAGLIKTVEALQHRLLPPTLHVVTPNPELNIERSAFYINTALTSWETDGTPRRAAVSSFGIGGTNAHVVLEEAEAPEQTALPAHPWHLLTLSARTETALQQARTNLRLHVEQHPELDLRDVAYTLQIGRKPFAHRSVLVCRDREDALEVLATCDPSRLLSAADPVRSRAVVFLFPGQGTQYSGMGRELYQTEAVFRAEVDRCAELLLPALGLDLRSLLYPDEAEAEQASSHLSQTWLTQPALFVIEYALAQLWLSWGVTPTAMLGHSIGEYVAACLAGVFPLEIALHLVALRGRLMQQLPRGAMLAVSLPLAELRPLLTARVSLAAMNTPEQCVVAGPQEEIEQLTHLLSEQGAFYSHLQTSHAFHSQMMEPIITTFVAQVSQQPLYAPRLPYVSNVSGTWISSAQATDPAYWGQHLRETVRFADGVRTLLQETDWAFLEVGPGRTLATFVKQQQSRERGCAEALIVSSLPHAKGAQSSDRAFILTSLGRLWLGKVSIDWRTLPARRRVSLPTYPFERQRYWVERSLAPMFPTISHQNGEHAPRQEALEVVDLPLEPRVIGNGHGPRPAATVKDAPADVATLSHARPSLPVAYRAPNSELEQRIADIWQQLFGISSIGVDDPFFELGGDSLLAVQMRSQLHTSLQIDLTLSDLFEAGTIAGVAQKAEALMHAHASVQAESDAELLSTVDVPLSFTQRRLWLLERLEPGNPVLTIALALGIQGPLDLALMERCFQEITRRQAALRTHFVEIAGEPVQRIVPALRLPLPVIDLQHLPAGERERALECLIAQEARSPFDLAQVPLIRTTMVRLHLPGYAPRRQAEQVLLLSMHHSISDGWSMGVFLKEFSALYAAFAYNHSSPLPALPLQYVDFVAQQRAQAAELETHLRYWRAKLAGDLPILELPTDYPRLAVPAYRGMRQRLQLSKALMCELQALGQHEGATFFMVVLSAFQVLLSRYSGQEDILVATPVANRRREMESIIGPFINRLVLRTDLSGDPTFQQLLERVREGCLQAYTHQEVPFDLLVETLNPPRDSRRAPLTQVLLRLPNAPLAPIKVADLTVSILPMNVETANQDLTLDMIELPDGLEAAIEYNSELFAPATMTRLLQHWRVLLEAVVANPQARLSQLPLLTPAESQTILSEWNQSQIAMAGEQPPRFVHELFERQVELTPDAVAVSLEAQQVSYGALNRRANQVARHLQKLGVGPEVLVGVCLERSLELMVGMLGILKAGGAYVPLDPGYPEDRLAFLLHDAQVSLLLVHEQSRLALPAHRTWGEVALDRDWARIASQPVENLVPAAHMSSLAYVIYTSGSTGQPKGVLVAHTGLVNLVEVQTQTFGVECRDHILQFASASFDASLSEVFMTLCMGARLSLARAERLLPGQALVELLYEQHISLVTLPPSALSAMEPEALPTLRTLIVAGEVCPAEMVQRWSKGRRFFNAYGPTEGTVCTTIAPCSEEMAGPPPIGRPISQMQAYILDAHLGLVPVGVVGQVYIGGRGVVRGYLHRPDLTAERFVPHPFSSEPGLRLYQSGDRARYLPDGTLEFVGRVDQQVKVRGYRIELGEIEAVLSQHPAVRECAVVVQEKQWEDKRLVAYVVGRDQTAESRELREYLKRHLPEYLLPGMVVFLEALPLTANGKVDRRALALWQQEERVAEDDQGTPRTMIEELISDICKDILQLEWVSRQDNFFEKGGHSLLGAQLVARIRQALGVEVPITALFEAGTIAEFCASVEAAFRSQQGVELPPLVPVQHQGALPLSFAQQRMWFLDQLQPGNAFYNVVAPFRVNEPLHVAALEQSLQEMVHRHEVLRTIFVMLEEEPCQIIMPSLHLPLLLVDLSRLSIDVREVELQRQAALEGQQPFNLARGPLLRARLFRMGGMQEHVLLLTLHNSISDGWSRGIVMRELTALYQAFRAGKNHDLPDLPVQYADFALWQRQWLQSEALAAQTSYWLQQLAGAPSLLELPTDHPRPAVQTYRGRHQAVYVPASMMQALKDISQQEGCTLFMVVLAAFLVLLSRYSGQEDIVIGTPIAGRNLVEIEDLIGFFTNTLVLRIDLSGNPTFLELLQHVRDVALGAYVHQDLPFEKLVEIVQPERNLSHSPLFQVMFTLQDELSMKRESDWLAPAELEIETETAKFDLNLFLNNGIRGLEGVIEYNTDLFDSTTITDLLRHWSILLEGIIANPYERLASVPLLTDEEHQLLINKLAKNRTKDTPRIQPRIAVTATFTAEPLEESLAWWLNELNWTAEIRFAPYQQLFQQLLDSESLLQSNHNGINVLLVRFEDWLRIKDDTHVAIECLPDSPAKVERNVLDLLQAVRGVAQPRTAPYLLCICPPSPAILSNEVLQKLFQRMEHLLFTELGSDDGVYVITSTELADTYPLNASYDPVGDEIGHVPYTPALFAALGTMITRKIAAIYRRPYKVIAVDCDNTLWKGICGEDGAMGVELSAPYLALQRFLVAQQEAGMLICLCSKNNEADVLDVFAKRHEMPLQLKHLAATRINWQAKSQNLLALAQELQLGIDSFILIDDSPLECAEVQQYCPQVFTLPLPSDVAQWPDLVKHTWIFDHLRLTEEDRMRTGLYQQNRARAHLQQEVPTLKEFLVGLELKIHINPIVELHLDRVAQLTQRTNQFNCTTRRRSVSEIAQYLSKPAQEGLVVEVRDRFGDYGKVGVVLFALHEEVLVVDTFLMSCRSMGRGVEHRMLARLGERALEMGLRQVLVPYLPTGKNKPAWDFLEEVGTTFKRAEANGAWSFVFPAVSLVELSYSPPDKPDVPGRGDEIVEPAIDLASRAKQTMHDDGIYSHLQITPQNILRIAHELSSAEPVLQAISSWKKQSTGLVAQLEVARTRTEVQLAEIWQQLLHIEQAGVNDSFFGLGGHSLLATQLLSRIVTVFGIRLSLQVIFERSTIAQLAGQIDEMLRAEEKHRGALPAIRRLATGVALPLSFGQQRLWFLDRLAPGNSSYTIPLRIRLQGTLDLAALQASLQEIVLRHAVLRTTFSASGDEVHQVIASGLVLRLPLVDLQQLPAVQRQREMQQLLKEEWQTTFRLEHGPLLRTMVLRVEAQEAIVAITLHHIVFDAWSAGVLSRELVALYTAFHEKQPSPLAPLPIQYADFALWQRAWLQGEVLQRLEMYWRERLRGAAPLHLPGELPASTRHSFQGERIPFALSPDLSSRLMVLSQQEDVTLFMTLLAAFQTLLYRSTGQTDLVIGTDIANRTLSETEHLIGFFVNLLVLRTDLNDQPTFGELLQRVREGVLEAYAHQDLPFEKLVDMLQTDRKLNHAPLVRALFVLQNTPRVPITLPGLTISPVEMEVDTVNFDLVVFMYEEPQGLRGVVHYSADVCDSGAMQQLVEHFLTLLADIPLHCDVPLEMLAIYSEAEQQQLLLKEAAQQEERRRKLKVARRKGSFLSDQTSL